MPQDERPDLPPARTTGAVCGPVPVRFTVADGWRGWQEARQRRLPCYGAGSVEVQGAVLILRGWQRTWLGVATEAAILVPFDQVRNVVTEGTIVHAQCRIGRRWRGIAFAARTESEAVELSRHLPDARVPGFDAEWAELKTFHQQIAAASGRPWVTPTVACLNLVTFALLLLASGGMVPTLDTLQRFGANVGMLTTHGEWWRLLASTFLHFNLLHIAVNLAALWGVGRLTERLYGSPAFLALYLGSGVLASLTSTLWNPNVISAGASGAIFGVFGAFIAYLLHGETRVPKAFLRAHGLSMLLFVVYNLAVGALQPAIDNAAHVGGLVAGFGLGWLLVRPLANGEREPLPTWRLTSTLALFGAALVTGVAMTRVDSPDPNGFYASLQTVRWFTDGESRDGRIESRIAGQLQRGEISPAAFADTMEHDVLPFWVQAEARLSALPQARSNDVSNYAVLMRRFVTARRAAIEATIAGARSSSTADQAELNRALAEVTATTATLERARTHESLERMPHGLRLRLQIAWHGWWARRGWACVEMPGRPVPAGGESRRDGPWLRHAAGCEFQQLFLRGEYAALDAQLQRWSARLADLPDGSSTLSGALHGFDALLDSNTLNVMEVLARLSDWQRAVPHSIYPVLFEASAYGDWAWLARGHDFGDRVSGQDIAAFRYRTALAAAALTASAPDGQSSPLWYQLALSNALDAGWEHDRLRALFDEGERRFTRYLPLYRQMLRTLMPRWGGSRAEVARFIDEMSRRHGHSEAIYARLYAEYALLENDNADYVEDGSMNWSRVQVGFREMLREAPDSDYLVNAYANLACLENDRDTYRRLRPQLERQRSLTAWSSIASLKQCDRELSTGATGPVVAPELATYRDQGGNVVTEVSAAAVRQQVKAALAAAQPVRDAIGEYVAVNGRPPPDEVIAKDVRFKARKVDGATVQIGLGGSVVMRLDGGPLDGHQFSWTPMEVGAELRWICAEETVPTEYLSAPCR